MTKHVYSFGQGQPEGDPKRRDLLGGKGAGLAEMTSLGLPVPPGFTITTEVCTSVTQTGKYPESLRDEVKEALAKIESHLGMRFGDSERPLLVSVRSGARASMPGMMDTILNLGLNDATVDGLAKRIGNRRFVLDSYRRFLAMYSGVALGVKKEHFDHALDEVRKEVAREKNLPAARVGGEMLQRAVPDSDIPAEKLEKVVAAFKAIVEKETGKPFPQDPEAQLWGAIGAVFESWNNQRAVVYRKMYDIPDSWGTACNVQAMVFGNLGDTSATGVAFTRNPSTGEKLIYGEWLPNAQGEDVVAGIRTPRPVLKSGAEPGQSLEEAMPEAFAALMGIADKLETHFRDMQDLEFTIQEGNLFMLQCRTGKRTAKAAIRIACELVREGRISSDEAVLRVDPGSLDQLLHPTLDPKADKVVLARGLAASPGAASGHIVFDADEAQQKAEQGVPLILVRLETSPEDIHGMKSARGILTARGGMTSHAAVVARGMGKPCVAGCPAISIDYGKQMLTVATESGETVTLKKGDAITIDGGTGVVYAGIVPTVPAGLSGDFDELMTWADASRTMKVRSNADTPIDARTARAFGAEGIGLCRTEHMFFDDERIGAMREMILSESKDQRERALAKLLPFQRQDFVGLFREMEGLPVTIRLLDPPLHEFLPHERKQIEALSIAMGVSAIKLEERARDLHEQNPMLGHRGVRLAITYSEIYAMQVRAILEAAVQVKAEGKTVLPEIMIPLAISKRELDLMKQMVDEVAAEVFASNPKVDFLFGTMIELPRAALKAGELAETAEFFSFGTNDLTQATLGLSRDDAGKFLPAYVEAGILPKDPFVSIDQEGVGELVRMGRERGKSTRPGIKTGVCGEHGGDPASIRFFQTVGLDYVSCSPFRVPIARLAAAQAGLESRGAKGGSGTA